MQSRRAARNTNERRTRRRRQHALRRHRPKTSISVGEPAVNHVGLGKKRDFIAEALLRAAGDTADNQEGLGFDNDCNETPEPLDAAIFLKTRSTTKQRTYQGRDIEFLASSVVPVRARMNQFHRHPHRLRDRRLHRYVAEGWNGGLG